MTELAKKLAAHPRFQWVKGMKAVRDANLGWWELVGTINLSTHEEWWPTNDESPDEWYPDLGNSGVIGGLIHMLDEVCDPRRGSWTLTRGRKGWVVTGHTCALAPGPLHKTAGEALATALLDVWSTL